MAGGQLTPGTVFAGDYRIHRLLATGGMGAVYVAEQISTGKARALKLMRPELGYDPRLRERFAQEARVGAHIRSEHIVEVVGAGIDPTSHAPWLAMELLEGCDFAQYVAKHGPVPATQVRVMMSQAAHALRAAHAAGIIHRDLKPENLFVAQSKLQNASTIVKVLDFGVAKMVLEAQAQSQETVSVGTPRWMAPEQTEASANIGPPADVWSIGLLAYFLLTGRFYWQHCSGPHASMPKLLREILVDPIAPASHRAAEQGVQPFIPPNFDAWFDRCVRRPPHERYPEAGAAVDALGVVLDNLSTQPQPFGHAFVQSDSHSSPAAYTHTPPGGHDAQTPYGFGLGPQTPYGYGTGPQVPYGHGTGPQMPIGNAPYAGGAPGPNIGAAAGATGAPFATTSVGSSRGGGGWIAVALGGLCVLGLGGVAVVFRSEIQSAVTDDDSKQTDDDDDHKKAKKKKKKKKDSSDDDDDKTSDDDDRADEPTVLSEQPIPKSPVKVGRIEPGEFAILSASNPSGSNYGGSVQALTVGRVTNLVWRTSDGAVTQGLAVASNGNIVSGFGAVSTYGVAVYAVTDSGLHGLITANQHVGVFADQSLKGSKSIGGVYRVTSKENPTSVGSCTISKRTGGYELQYKLGTGDFIGVGVEHDDFLYVAWALSGSPVGVVLYTEKNDQLRGKWLLYGGPGVGTEVLKRTK